jgi:hypothetical protein
MNTNQEIERVRAMLQGAKKDVQAEVAKCEAGQTAVDSERNLRWIASSLDEMSASLDRTDRPEAPGLWRVVTDRWPLVNFPLSEKVLSAENAYKKLR